MESKGWMKRTVFAAIWALGALGCGDGGGGTVGGTTHSLASAVTFNLPPSSCQKIKGPDSITMGTTFYEIDDRPPGGDDIESIIIGDSFYISYGCNLSGTPQAITDDTFTGSHQSTDTVPVADSYDFIVLCRNLDVDCWFDLTWTATY